MSREVGIGCKTCGVTSDMLPYHENAAAGILSLLPAIMAFVEAVRATTADLAIHDDIYGTALIDFAVEHHEHDLYIVDENNCYGKTLEDYLSVMKRGGGWPD